MEQSDYQTMDASLLKSNKNLILANAGENVKFVYYIYPV